METFQENKNNLQKPQKARDLSSPLSSSNALANVPRKLSEKEIHKSIGSAAATGAMLPSITDEDRKILKKVNKKKLPSR